MTRIRTFAPEQMTEAQRRVYDATVAGKRGRAPAPLNAWLRSPELAARAQSLGEFVRYDTTLSPRFSELAILVVARIWTAHVEWRAHKSEALKAGLPSEIIDDIADRRRPRMASAEELLVYDFVHSLCVDHAVPEALYQQAVAVFGEDAVVELVGILGYYTLVAMTLNTFEVSLPDGTEPDLK
jgi:4-carboxymuconolactone decarboxylase